ncbi:MAG: TonB-dependent siderophore receptor [Gammaproteobacteria bacterium]|nr:TonB-dependent siderophore receptor [Gammaproteobacteria bacterium]
MIAVACGFGFAPVLAADTGSTLNQVVVTAQKEFYRGDTPLEQLPQSVAVVSDSLLKVEGITRLDDALSLVSGIAPQNNFGGLWDAYAIRGFAGNENLPSGYLVNGFNWGRGFVGPRDMSDVERIEVIKGPDSALFGRGEPGGTVNIVTKKPLFHEQGYAALSGGSFQDYRAEGDFTGPLTSWLAGRINGAYENSHSFRNTVKWDKYVVTPSFFARLGDRTTLSYELELIRQAIPFDRGVVGRNDQLGIVPISTFLGEPGNGPTVVNVISHQLGLQHDLRHGWTLQLGLGALRSSLLGTGEDPELAASHNPFLQGGDILARRRRSRNYHSNDVVPRGEISGKISTGPLVHHVLFGADYDHLRLDEALNQYRPPFVTPTTTITQLNGVNIFDPVYGNLPPMKPFTNTLETDKDWGVYAHDQIDFGSKWNLHAGVRYDDFKQSLLDRIAASTSQQNVTSVSPDVGLVFKPIDNIELYTSYGKGFRPNTGQDAHGAAFQPEITRSYEAGVKFKTSGGWLNGTADVFKTDKTNVLTSDPANPGFSLSVGAAESRGVELDLNGRLPAKFSYRFSYAYVDAYFSKPLLDPDFGRPLPAGTPLINVPKNSGSVMLARDFNVGEALVNAGGAVTYVSSQLGETGTTFYLPSYTLVKVFGAVNLTEALQLSANVDNLFNKTYYLNSYAQLWVTPGAPRTFNVKATYRF